MVKISSAVVDARALALIDFWLSPVTRNGSSSMKTRVRRRKLVRDKLLSIRAQLTPFERPVRVLVRVPEGK